MEIFIIIITNPFKQDTIFYDYLMAVCLWHKLFDIRGGIY